MCMSAHRSPTCACIACRCIGQLAGGRAARQASRHGDMGGVMMRSTHCGWKNACRTPTHLGGLIVVKVN